MARPRTLGPTISFRLPLELHAVAAHWAERNGMSVNDYLTARLVDALSRQLAAQQPKKTDDKKTVDKKTDPKPRPPVNPRWKNTKQ